MTIPLQRRSSRSRHARLEAPADLRRAGAPLAAEVTAAGVPDVTMLQAMVDDILPVRTPSGRRRTRPDKLDAATVDDRAASRGDLRRRGIAAADRPARDPVIDRLGRHRWRVERAREAVPRLVFMMGAVWGWGASGRGSRPARRGRAGRWARPRGSGGAWSGCRRSGCVRW